MFWGAFILYIYIFFKKKEDRGNEFYLGHERVLTLIRFGNRMKVSNFDNGKGIDRILANENTLVCFNYRVG